MKLSDQSIQLIKKVALSASQLGIENILITPKYITGADPTKTTTLFDVANEGVFSHDIALTRLPFLKSRLKIAESNHEVVARVKSSGSDSFIDQLTFSDATNKITYRCAVPSMIVGPRECNDVPCIRLQLSKTDVAFIKSASGAVDVDLINFVISSKKAIVTFIDSAGDKLSRTLDNSPIPIIEGADSFIIDRSYPQKNVLRCLQENDPIVEIGRGLKNNGGFLFGHVEGIRAIFKPMQ